MEQLNPTLPDHYRSSLRIVLRYAIIMIFVALLIGIFFQESSKKMDYSQVPPGVNLEAKIHLALVHGHVFLIAVILPLVLAGAVLMARKVGGQELTSRRIKWLTRGYLPFATLTVALQFYKGLHFIYSARSDHSDFQAISDSLFAGSAPLRHGLYGLSHTGMAIGLGVFLFFLWGSLKQRT